MSNEKQPNVFISTSEVLITAFTTAQKDQEMMMMMMDSFPKLFEDHQLFSELKAGRKMGAFNPDYCRHPVPKL